MVGKSSALLIVLLTGCFMAHAKIESIQITKKVLDNGLTVLVVPRKTTQQVMVQLWYRVGSKHEQNVVTGGKIWSGRR